MNSRKYNRRYCSRRWQGPKQYSLMICDRLINLTFRKGIYVLLRVRSRGWELSLILWFPEPSTIIWPKICWVKRTSILRISKKRVSIVISIGKTRMTRFLGCNSFRKISAKNIRTLRTLLMRQKWSMITDRLSSLTTMRRIKRNYMQRRIWSVILTF